MSLPLIIVESPAKAKTIGKFLDNRYQILASMGHVRDLPKHDMGVDVEHGFEPTYEIDDSASNKKVVAALRKAAKGADAVFLASDHDREGEAIAWHLAELLHGEIGKKPVYRIVFNEITKQAIVHALEQPGHIDRDKVDAQQARRILDRLVGYKISPLLWKVLSGNLSAGRVQSVALRLICEREEAIEAFVPEEYWTLDAVLHKGKLAPFKAALQTWKGEAFRPANQQGAEEVLHAMQGAQFNITELKRSTRSMQPQPPYITSTLQQDASRVLGYSAKRTMQIAQALYEGVEVNGESVGLITYMRTDSLRIADEAMDACRRLVGERWGAHELFDKVRTFKNKSSAQDAHEAIRPTDPFRTPEQTAGYLTAEQAKLYTLIWQRFAATQMRPAKLQTLNLSITAGEGVFGATGSTVAEQGYMLAYPHTILVLGEKIDAAYAQGDALEVDELTPNQHFTKPPARYTEASLIRELEAKGIGRPSTYAQITNTIIERTYVELIQKKFHPTELGRAVNRFLVNHFDKLFNVRFTAEMEKGLDEVEYGNQEWRKLLEEYWAVIVKLLEKVDLKESKKNLQEPTDIVCDKCGSMMVIKWGRRGQFLACSNYPACSNVMNFKRDENGAIHVHKDEELDEVCPDCGGKLTLKSGRFGKFVACANYPTCKYTRNLKQGKKDENGETKVQPDEPLDEKCPKCGAQLVKKQSKHGQFISCSAYPKCKYTRDITTGITCPECKQGELVHRVNKRGKDFWGCSRYPDCKYICSTEPVSRACPKCGYGIMQKRVHKGVEVLVCPACKHEEA